MQYDKCRYCEYNGKPCKIIMAQAMGLLWQVGHLVDYAQTRKTDSRCKLKIDFSCENFTPRKEEENA